MKNSNSYKDLERQLKEAHKKDKSFSAVDVMKIVDNFIYFYEIETQPNNSGKWLLDHLYECTKIRRKALNKSKLKERLKTYSVKEIKQAILNASRSSHHIESGFRYMHAEFWTRNNDIIEKWLHSKVDVKVDVKVSNIRQSVNDIYEGLGTFNNENDE